MVLVASALARLCFGEAAPDVVAAAERKDPKIVPMVQRVIAHWLVKKPDVSRRSLSADRWRLHDGAARQVRYVARTMMLPGPPHVARNPFPELFSSLPAYLPIKIAQDVGLPLVQAGRYLLSQVEYFRNVLAGHELALMVMPLSAETRR